LKLWQRFNEHSLFKLCFLDLASSFNRASSLN